MLGSNEAPIWNRCCLSRHYFEVKGYPGPKAASKLRLTSLWPVEYSVPHFPGEDSKLRANRVQTRRGGNVPNTLEVLSQLIEGKDEVKLHLIAPLPERGSLATEQVQSSFCYKDSLALVDLETCLYRDGQEQAASSYIIRSESSGSRTIVNHNELPEMTAIEFAEVVTRFRASGQKNSWWHFEGRIPETTIKCIQTIREALPDAHVSVEAEKPGRAGLDQLVAEADVVFYSRCYAEVRTPLSKVKTAGILTETEHRHSSQRAEVISLPTINNDGLQSETLVAHMWRRRCVRPGDRE